METLPGMSAATVAVVVPVINRSMAAHPATQRNVAQLAADGVVVFGPAAGDQACGETGMGRMLEPEELLQSILEATGLPHASTRADSSHVCLDE